MGSVTNAIVGLVGPVSYEVAQGTKHRSGGLSFGDKKKQTSGDAWMLGLCHLAFGRNKQIRIDHCDGLRLALYPAMVYTSQYASQANDSRNAARARFGSYMLDVYHVCCCGPKEIM